MASGEDVFVAEDIAREAVGDSSPAVEGLQ